MSVNQAQDPSDQTKLPIWEDSSKTYHICLLPRDSPHIDTYAAKYRSFRMFQLADSSTDDAALSSPDIEVSKPDSFFRAKLQDSRRLTVIATHLPSGTNKAISTTDSEHRLLHGTWVSIGFALGPHSLADYRWPNSGGLKSDSDEVRWHIGDLFTVPEHRGLRPAFSVTLPAVLRYQCAAASLTLIGAKARAAGKTAIQMRLRTSVLAHKERLINVYQRTGSTLAGYTVHGETVRARENGYEMPVDPAAEGVADSAVLETVWKVRLDGACFLLDGAKL